MSDTFKELLNYVETLTIIDTHEHLPNWEDKREKPADILSEYLTHYFNRDLVTAGLTVSEMKRARDCAVPLMERWKLVEPYWEYARNTGYGRSLDITVQALYGYDRIDGSTIEAINGKFLSSLNGGQYKKVLKDLCKIETSMLDDGEFYSDCDSNYFTQVGATNDLVHILSHECIKGVSAFSGCNITCFDDWLAAVDITLDKMINLGVKVFKCSLAYHRSLSFNRVAYNTAEVAYNKLEQTAHYPDWDGIPIARDSEATIELGNYMMHRVLRKFNQHGLTMQVHTGLHEGNGNIIQNSEPSQMSNLFLAYPNVKFDLFHIAYPYYSTLSALAKTFPNVYIDMCWAHIISPQACVTALTEWLDAVPYNKISAFGGDYCFIDAVYGHQYLARRNVAKALAVKVNDGCFSIEKGKVIAKALFYDNPKNLFKL